MTNSTHFHRQLLDFLRQYSHSCDLRHLKALAWMVSALICSGQLSLSAWEPYVSSRAKQAQSVERLDDFWAMSGLRSSPCMCHWCWRL